MTPAAAARPDRRPERSRKALVGALVALILERGYESLTAEDVAARADVGRSTLYAHFGGLGGVLREALTAPSSGLAALVDGAATPAQLAPLLDHFKRQRRRNAAFFQGPVRTQWVRRLAELIEPKLEALARAQGRAPSPLGWGFVATQIAEAQISLVTNWLTTRPGVPAEAVAAALIATTRALVEGLLGVGGE
jgi:AcrR family transcriptional regulator